MSKLQNIVEKVKESEYFSDIKTSSVRDVLNGRIFSKTFFRKQYKLIALIAFLAFLYVDNRYNCETQLATEIKLKKQIQDVKYESLTISAELMQISRQSNVLKMINERGLHLKESDTPPIIIEDSITEE